MIEQVGTAFPPDAVRGLIEESMHRVGIHPDRIERVCIASPDRYDDLRAEVSAGVAQPLGPGMTSLGWTWARNVNDKITSTVVLLDRTVDRALAGDRRAAFVISHELGHGGDFAERGKVSIPDMPHTEPFRLEIVTDFYVERYLQEFGANRHAAPVVPEEQLAHDIREVEKVICRCREIVQDCINGYRGGHISNAFLAYQVSGSAWELLISIGSIHGYMFTGAAIAEHARREMARLNDDLEQGLRSVSERVAAEYPNISPGCLSQLHDTWMHVIARWRFTFQTTLEGHRISFPGHP